jgi:hypothetical protein
VGANFSFKTVKKIYFGHDETESRTKKKWWTLPTFGNMDEEVAR